MYFQMYVPLIMGKSSWPQCLYQTCGMCLPCGRFLFLQVMEESPYLICTQGAPDIHT